MIVEEAPTTAPAEPAPETPVCRAEFNALFARLRKVEKRLQELEHRQDV